MIIKDKATMYTLLAGGELGNTTPLFFTARDWLEAFASRRYPLWGVRSMTPGDPRSRLNLSHDETLEYVRKNYGGLDAKVVLAPMVDQWSILRAEFYDSPHGAVLEYIDPKMTPHLDPTHPWRDGFRRFRKRKEGIMAHVYLRSFMNENSYDDLLILLDRFPGHVIEFTCLDRCRGTVPHRNAVIWEVRNY